jgi:hypothetical protein
MKLALAGGLSVGFCAVYFPLGYWPVMPTHRLPLTWVDRAAGFDVGFWVWVYQSVYLPINLIPWLATSLTALRRYAIGFVALSLVSFIVFFLLPVQAPKPSAPDPRGMYWLLQTYDATYNAMPSLHAALLLYTIAFGRRVLAGATPRGFWLGVFVWAGLILYATLATKEHYAIDIVAGAFLAIVVHASVWRRGERDVTEQPPQQGADVPRRVEVMVGPEHRIDPAGQVEGVGQ